MAKIELTKEWVSLPYASGTIQNLSKGYNIEVCEMASDGNGQILFPEQTMSFNTQLYARVSTESENPTVECRVSPFTEAAGGSGGASSYVLPAATKDVLGGVKIGDGISIKTDGTISTAGTDYLASLAMPSDKFINGVLTLGTSMEYTAPDSGYVVCHLAHENVTKLFWVIIQNNIRYMGNCSRHSAIMYPVNKNTKIVFNLETTSGVTAIESRFIYSVGAAKALGLIN